MKKKPVQLKNKKSPIKPRKPTEPSAPSTVLVETFNLEIKDGSLEDILNNFKEYLKTICHNYPRTLLTDIDSLSYSSVFVANPMFIDCGSELTTTLEFVNPDFKKQQILYKKRLEKYNQQMKQYNQQMKQYNQQMKQYNQQMKQYRIELKEFEAAEKEKEILELKNKLKKLEELVK